MTERDPLESIRRRIADNPKLAEEVAMEKKRMERRQVLTLGGAAALIATVGSTLGLNAAHDIRARFRFAEAARAETPPRVPSEHFERAKSSFKKLYGSMKENQVQFIDHFASPIGEPHIAPLIDDPERPGRRRIDQTWLDAQRRRICDTWQPVCDPAEELPRQVNVIGHLRGRPEGTTFVDVLANAEHGGAAYEGTTRIKYVANEIGIHVSIENGRVMNEVCRLIPALIGQESSYRDDVTSEDGALSSVQGMPATIADLGYTVEDLKDFKKQVEFVGAAFSQNYSAITRVARAELRDIKKEFFPDGYGAATFDEDFLAPVVVNAYNAGSGTMVAVLRWFREKYPNRAAYERAHGPQPVAFGRDLFLRMTQEAYFENAVELYGEQSCLYWIGIEGLAAEMKERNLY